jgi:predicted O-methyltransferase YrrM
MVPLKVPAGAEFWTAAERAAKGRLHGQNALRAAPRQGQTCAIDLASAQRIGAIGGTTVVHARSAEPASVQFIASDMARARLPRNAAARTRVRRSTMTTNADWIAVEHWLDGHLLAADPILDAVLAANAVAGLPAHDVSPAQGKLLHLLARIAGARTILEIGTLGAYSTIWLARALPADGVVVTLEADPRHATVARANLARAGVAARVELRVGAALDTLPLLEAEHRAPFDLVFVDADKRSNVAYLDWALRLARPGATIVIDNVVRDGAVLDATSDDESVRGVRALAERIAHEPRVAATALQTVGGKGWDGFVLALVRDDVR